MNKFFSQIHLGIPTVQIFLEGHKNLAILQGVTAISGKRFKLIFLVLIYVVLKQTIYQQKALDLSFNLAP